MRLLLLSNSTNFGEPYLSWCNSVIAEFLGEIQSNLLFIPYAAVGFSYDNYTERVNQALVSFNIRVKGIHEFEKPDEALKESSGYLVGGGNTFQLLKMLQEKNLLDLLKEELNKGKPYIGWSAGSNIAGKTIRTTNDMPIVEPKSFNSLSLVDYQINPHYTEKTIPNHGGESRLQRLMEFVEANKQEKVVCLPESSYIRVEKEIQTYMGNQPGLLLEATGESMIEPGDLLPA